MSEKIHIHITEYLKNLTKEDIQKSIKSFLEWQKGNTKWDKESQIYKMYRIYYEPLMYDQVFEEPAASGMDAAYDAITGELAKRWINDSTKKLILSYHWGDEPCSGTGYVSFEYESKDKFVFDVLEKYKNFSWEFYTVNKSPWDTNKVELFEDVWLTKGEIESIEKSVYHFEEWFDGRKQNLK